MLFNKKKKKKNVAHNRDRPALVHGHGCSKHISKTKRAHTHAHGHCCNNRLVSTVTAMHLTFGTTNLWIPFVRLLFLCCIVVIVVVVVAIPLLLYFKVSIHSIICERYIQSFVFMAVLPFIVCLCVPFSCSNIFYRMILCFRAHPSFEALLDRHTHYTLFIHSWKNDFNFTITRSFVCSGALGTSGGKIQAHTRHIWKTNTIWSEIIHRLS